MAEDTTAGEDGRVTLTRRSLPDRAAHHADDLRAIVQEMCTQRSGTSYQRLRLAAVTVGLRMLADDLHEQPAMAVQTPAEIPDSADGREAMSGDKAVANLRGWLEGRAANEADADAYEAGLLQVHSDRDYWQDETVKATARAEQAEAEVKRYRSFCGEALCGDVERDRERLQAAIDRTTNRMAEYHKHGSRMVNVRQVMNLLSLTWPDGNYSSERLPSRDDIEAGAPTHHPEAHHAPQVPDPAVPDPKTVTEVVAAIRDDIGSFGLGQLGKHGLSDMIWKHHAPFHTLNADQQQAWLNAACEDLGWAPWS